MKKLIASIIALALSGAVLAGQDHTCQGGHNCNDQGGATQILQTTQVLNNQEQVQGQLQFQKSISGSESDSTSKSYSDSTSKSYSEGGSSKSISKGGSSKSSSQGGSSTSGSSNDINIDHGYEEAAASAASLYSQGCQVGVSGQTKDGGTSILLDDFVCSTLKLVDAEAEALKRCKPADQECIDYHEERIHHFLEVAGDHIDDTENTAGFAKNGLQLGIGSLGIAIPTYLLILLL
jgi:hypothetical protein